MTTALIDMLWAIGLVACVVVVITLVSLYA